VKVSVVIPTHNVARWIEETLASVRAQSRPAEEVIVVDDGSQDETLALVRRAGVATTVLQVNHGNAAAVRNRGVEAASGDWIAFLDGDDIWEPDHLERFSETVSWTDVAYFARHECFDDSTGQLLSTHPLRTTAAYGLSDDSLLQYLVGKNHGWSTSGMIVRRHRFLAAGGFDEEQLRRHDVEMFLRVAKGHTWAYEPKPTWRYRANRLGNISGDRSSCSIYMLRALIKIEALYPDDRLAAMISRQARKALSYALKSERASEWEWAQSLALERVGMAHELFYRIAGRAPRLARAALHAKARMRACP